MAKYWQNLDAPAFSALDKSWQGIPTVIAKGYDPKKYTERKALTTAPAAAKPTLMEKIATGMGSFVKGGTFGVLDALNRKINPKLQAKIEEMRQQNPEIAKWSELGGAVTTGFTNPATVGAGFGAGLKALIPGSRMLPTLARSAIQTATTSVPTAIGELANTGNVGETAKHLAINTGLGALGGAAVEKLLAGAPKLVGALKRKANDQVLIAAGIDPRSLRNVVQFGPLGKKAGAMLKRVEQLKDEAAEFITKNGAWFRNAKLKAIQEGADAWQAIDDQFAAALASGAKPSKIIEKTLPQHVDLQYLNSVPGLKKTATEYAKEFLGQIDQIDDLPTIRRLLQDEINLAVTKGQTITARSRGYVAQAIRDSLDAAFVPDELKAAYPVLKLLKEAQAKADMRLDPLIGAANSATAARTGVMDLLKKGTKDTGGGAILGGIATSRTSGFDPNDPETWPKALGRIALGTVAGGALNKAAPRLFNTILGGTAGAARAFTPDLTKLAEAAPAIGGAASRIIGGGAAQKLAGTGEAEVPAAADAAVQQAEAAAGPEAKEQAKEQVNTAWADRIRSKLDGMYDMYIAPQYGAEMSREQFIAAIAQATDNFDPRYTAGAIFPEKKEREQYLRSYESAMKLQTIDLEQALEGNRGVLGLGGKDTETSIAYDKLRDFSAGLMAEPGKMPEKRVLDQVTAEINSIIGMKIPLARKKQLIRDHLANWGLDLDKLAEYGLVGGAA